MSRRPRQPVLVLLLGLLLLSGCALAPPRNPFNPESRSTELTIEVDNQNYNDVKILVLSIRGRELLGTVTGNGRRTFQLEWPGVDELSLRLEILGGGNYRTNRIGAGPGDTLQLLITSNPRNSVLQRR